MDLCFALAAGTAVLLRLPGPLTLAWEHSVERFALEEDYLATDAGVVVSEVRMRGLGAGVDLPAHARLADGWWRYTPVLAPQPRVVLAHSRWPAGYRVCQHGRCEPLDQAVGVADQPLALAPCAP
jgi:hypothetical protein